MCGAWGCVLIVMCFVVWCSVLGAWCLAFVVSLLVSVRCLSFVVVRFFCVCSLSPFFVCFSFFSCVVLCCLLIVVRCSCVVCCLFF